MSKAKRLIPTDHKDIIHDVAFDYYGRRMATCASDYTAKLEKIDKRCSMKIWDLTDDGQWKCTADWKIHTTVCKVRWAHPEFGQVIATCSFDGKPVVWEEQNLENSSVRKWNQKISLNDDNNPITDLKFAPKHLGLLLAMCYKDGSFRIYEAPDVTTLTQWTNQDIVVCKLSSASCISWNPSRSCSPLIAVGSDDNSTNNQQPIGKVEIYEFSSTSRIAPQKWVKIATLPVTDPVRDVSFAPNVGRSHNLLAVASKDAYIFSIKATKEKTLASGQPEDKYDIRLLATLADHESQVWNVDWNITGTILASTGDDGRVRLWKGNSADTWKCISGWKGDGSATPKTKSN